MEGGNCESAGSGTVSNVAILSSLGVVAEKARKGEIKNDTSIKVDIFLILFSLVLDSMKEIISCIS